MSSNPYQSPEVTDEAAIRRVEFAPQVVLTNLILGGLVCMAVLSAMNLLLGFRQWYLFSRTSWFLVHLGLATTDKLANNFLLWRFVTRLALALSGVTALCWAVWTVRALRNLRALGVELPRVGLLGSLRSWLIPLTLPYRTTLEIWERSEATLAELRGRAPREAIGPVGWWWTVTLAAAAMALLSQGMIGQELLFSQIERATIPSIIAAALLLLLALLSIRLIRTISARQRNAFDILRQRETEADAFM